MLRLQAGWFIVVSLWVAGVACDGTFLGAAEPAANRDPAGAGPGSPEFTGRFAGRVTGPTGAPLVGARVYAVPLTPDIESHGPVRATTNEQGQFEFDAADLTVLAADGLPKRRQALVIAAFQGLGADWTTTHDRWLPSQWLEFNFQLAADVPLEGQLSDAAGRPIAGGRVRVESLAIPPGRNLDRYLEQRKSFASENSKINYNPSLLPETTLESVTDGEGRFHLAGLGGERVMYVLATAPGYADKQFEIMSREESAVVLRRDEDGQPVATIYGARSALRMEPGVTLRGRVLDQVSREPIAGMPVSLNVNRTFRTDAEGRFTIGGVNPEIFTWMKQSSRSSTDYQFRVKAFPLPGMPYRFGSARIEDGDQELLIECKPGIPFRLRITDEAGKPVDADVTYRDIQPNPQVRQGLNESRRPISQAARQADGSYLGFVLPGPGAVLVRPFAQGYRPARVDPKNFFAPERAEWTAAEQTGVYGNHDILLSSHSILDQHDYAAIVLVNPRPDSPPLEISAQIVRDQPRIVNLVDTAGAEIVGAETHGLTYWPFDREPTLRTAKVTLAGLHPDRPQRITFLKRDRKLIGYLVARGDGVSPYSVVLRRWGKIKGRMVDVDGKPLPIGKPKSSWSKPPELLVQHLFVADPDPTVGGFAEINIEGDGNFSVDTLVPGQRYTGLMYVDRKSLGIAFENMSVEPGETRDLGDVRIQPAPLASTLPGAGVSNREQWPVPLALRARGGMVGEVPGWHPARSGR